MTLNIYINALMKDSETQEPLVLDHVIGNRPLFVILFEHLLQMSSYFKYIYMVIPHEIQSVLETEIQRWYSHSLDKIKYLSHPTNAVSFLHLVRQQKELCTSDCLLLSMECPFLSKLTLTHFLDFISSQSCWISLLVSKMNIRDEYVSLSSFSNESLSTLNHCPFSLDELSILEILWLSSTMEIPKDDYDSLFQVWIDQRLLTLYYIPVYISQQECLFMRSVETKRYMEDQYIQDRCSFYVYKCFELLKKNDSFEERLSRLEKKILSNK